MKNCRYFRHDWGARNDPKIQRLVRVKGASAKAVYWDLVEMLNEEGGTLPIDVIEDVAFTNRVDTEIAEYVVLESGLFSHDDACFWSERQRRDESKIKEISEVRQAAGRVGGIASSNQRRSKIEANAKQNGSKSEAINNINKINNIKNIDISSTKVSDISCQSPAENDAQENLFPEKNTSEEGKKTVEGLSDSQCKMVATYWNKIIASTGATFQKVITTSLSEERKNKIRIRWREFAGVGEPREVCRTVFTKACGSKFLQGEKGDWKADFDWIFRNGKNWVKIYEGNYDNHEGGGVAAGGFVERTRNGLQEIHDFFNSNGQKVNGNNSNNDNGTEAGPDNQGW